MSLHQGLPPNFSRFSQGCRKVQAVRFLHRAPVLKDLIVVVDEAPATVWLDLGNMNPRKFYGVCFVAGPALTGV